MRITGGMARGIPLIVPKGDLVRPATDAMRQAVFSSLGARVEGASFLDLFAGSGAYGLEAFSRGAAGGAFVERASKAIASIRQNIAAVSKSVGRPPENLRVYCADATSFLPTEFVPDLVFIDPPYDIIGDVAPAIFRHLAEYIASRKEALVILETPGEMKLTPDGWTCLKRLGKGVRQPMVSIFKPTPALP